jgi:hypothetical protein
MKRIIMVLAVAALMAVMMVAMAVPAFANSFASDTNKEGDGPNGGNNYGHSKKYPDSSSQGPGNGNTTAEFNPSYNGGPTNADGGVLLPKQSKDS